MVFWWFIFCLIYLLRVEVKFYTGVLVMEHVIKYLDSRAIILTCEVAQAQLPQAVVPVPPVVEEDSQRVASLVQFGATDDPQVLQRQVVELI